MARRFDRNVSIKMIDWSDVGATKLHHYGECQTDRQGPVKTLLWRLEEQLAFIFRGQIVDSNYCARICAFSGSCTSFLWTYPYLTVPRTHRSVRRLHTAIPL